MLSTRLHRRSGLCSGGNPATQCATFLVRAGTLGTRDRSRLQILVYTSVYILFSTADSQEVARVQAYCDQHALTISYGRQAAFGRHDPGYRIDIDSASSHASLILLSSTAIAFEIHP